MWPRRASGSARVLRMTPGLQFRISWPCAWWITRNCRAEWKRRMPRHLVQPRWASPRGAALVRPWPPGSALPSCNHLLSVSAQPTPAPARFFAPMSGPMVYSITGIWAGADWFSAEAFDMFGILSRPPGPAPPAHHDGFLGIRSQDFRCRQRRGPLLTREGRGRYQPREHRPALALVPNVIRHDNRYDPS